MTNTSSITNDYYLSSYQKPEKQTGNSSLGKDAFLQILITQLQNQDPTNPMDDREFISQMAQFSSLEQMQNVSTAVEKLLESQNQTQLMSYTTFIGRDVRWHEVTDELDDNGEAVITEGQGTIKELKFEGDQPVFILEDGKEITAGNISAVTDSNKNDEPENPLVEASQLIGKKVQYEVDGNIVEGTIQSVLTNNMDIKYILENDVHLTKDQFELITKD